MSRALELFNKTNQFNTTGERYTLEQCHQRFAAGRRLYVLQAEDRFTQYGLIGAAWVRQNCVHHVVMSCRALGLGIEDALLAHIANRLARRKCQIMLGQLQPTDANTACRQFYSRNGFIQAQGNPVLWSRPLALPLLSRLTLPSPRPAKRACPPLGQENNRYPRGSKAWRGRLSAGAAWRCAIYRITLAHSGLFCASAKVPPICPMIGLSKDNRIGGQKRPKGKQAGARAKIAYTTRMSRIKSPQGITQGKSKSIW